MLNDQELFIGNGVNGTTGEYGIKIESERLGAAIKDETELSTGEIKRLTDVLMWHVDERAELAKNTLTMLKQEQVQSPHKGSHRTIERQIKQFENALEEIKNASHLGTVARIKNPNDLSQAGWGLIFPAQADPKRVEEIKEALHLLIEWRKAQAQAGHEDYFQIFEGWRGYQPGESYLDFLERHQVGPGPVDPDKKVPYYLLLVGSPEEIPYEFQYHLDIQFAVGRLDFGDNLADYAQYAHNVVKAERQKQPSRPRKATFFGVANRHDPATQKSSDHLVKPLYDQFQTKHDLGWELELIPSEETTRERLEQLLMGDQTPSLLFTASHGVEFEAHDPRQAVHQGALLCQDWPGPKIWRRQVLEDFYFAGEHLDSQADLLGLITFHFACYGAGTPQMDGFSQLKGIQQQIAPRSFIAALPQRLLRQGVLATIGYVDRAWGYSFFWPGAGRQTAVFESTIERLLRGHSIGSAMEYFNQRQAELAIPLNEELKLVKNGKLPRKLLNIWTAHHDARNYIVLGDPATRLPTASTVVEEPPSTISISTEPLDSEENLAELAWLELELNEFLAPLPSGETEGEEGYGGGGTHS